MKTVAHSSEGEVYFAGTPNGTPTIAIFEDMETFPLLLRRIFDTEEDLRAAMKIVSSDWRETNETIWKTL